VEDEEKETLAMVGCPPGVCWVILGGLVHWYFSGVAEAVEEGEDAEYGDSNCPILLRSAAVAQWGAVVAFAVMGTCATGTGFETGVVKSIQLEGCSW
jgi:hypothetical protein